MYRLQLKPDAVVLLDGSGLSRQATPIATLKDEYGGVSNIIVDDHCYVLVNGSNTVKHWYHEAVEVLKTLPPLRTAQVLDEIGGIVSPNASSSPTGDDK
jgi:hypothetical protein